MKLQIQKILVWPLCLFLSVGFIFVGNSNVLCIGEDGHMVFETECPPCCGGTDKVCKLDVSNDLHDKHDECANCTDLTLDRLLWSQRLTRVSVDQSVKLLTVPPFHNTIAQSTPDKINSQVDDFPLTFGKTLPSASTAIAHLRC